MEIKQSCTNNNCLHNASCFHFQGEEKEGGKQMMFSLSITKWKIPAYVHSAAQILGIILFLTITLSTGKLGGNSETQQFRVRSIHTKIRCHICAYQSEEKNVINGIYTKYKSLFISNKERIENVTANF